MCLRYSFTVTNKDELKQRFNVDEILYELSPRYNIAPTQNVPVIFSDSPNRIEAAKWGLEPSFQMGVWGEQPFFNARGESVGEKPAFRESFAKRRCLMLADSFYEWKKPGKKPFRIALKGGKPFAFAGIFSEVAGEGNFFRGCCLITTEPNGLVEKVHDRMPAILRKRDEREWLEASPEDAKRLLLPFDEDEMEMQEISDRINSSKNDSADLVLPVKGKKTLGDYF